MKNLHNIINSLLIKLLNRNYENNLFNVIKFMNFLINKYKTRKITFYFKSTNLTINKYRKKWITISQKA